LALGVCLQKLDYFPKPGLIFKAEHLEELRPTVKAVVLPIRHLDELIAQADALLERKRIEEAIEKYNQAINFASSNFGIMAEQFSFLNKKLAQIYFRVGEI
jgi:tetratricopeptide (TPR) repeat protein